MSKTNTPIETLPALMARWWAGASLTQLAADYGLSRQRVHQLLHSVGCTHRNRSGSASLASPRRATGPQVAQAQALIAHPSARRLTPRQRGALCWRAQGLVLAEIARRMGASPQGVRNFIAAAQKKLAKCDPKTTTTPTTPPTPPVWNEHAWDYSALESLLAEPDPSDEPDERDERGAPDASIVDEDHSSECNELQSEREDAYASENSSPYEVPSGKQSMEPLRLSELQRLKRARP